MSEPVIPWKTIGQWLMILFAFVGVLLRVEHRLTTVEAAINQQMAGYAIAFQAIHTRMDRMEIQIDRLMERKR